MVLRIISATPMPFKLSIGVTVAALVIGSAFQNAYAAPTAAIVLEAGDVAVPANQPEDLPLQSIPRP